MIENSPALTNQQTELELNNHEACCLCQQNEGDYLFYHNQTQKWFHKQCFEEYTCHNSLSKLSQ